MKIDKPKPFILRKKEIEPIENWIKVDEDGNLIIDWELVPTVNIPFNPAPSLRPLGVQPYRPFVDQPIGPFNPNQFPVGQPYDYPNQLPIGQPYDPNPIHPQTGQPIWIVPQPGTAGNPIWIHEPNVWIGDGPSWNGGVSSGTITGNMTYTTTTDTVKLKDGECSSYSADLVTENTYSYQLNDLND